MDTPGFDDSREGRTDTAILKDVALFLSQIYERKILLAGIIYLHRITDFRMAGSSVKNLEMFKALCGEDAYKHVILATTMWGNLNGPGLSYEIGIQREKELVQRLDWWGLFSKRGSKIVRHTDDKRSALELIDYLVGLQKPVLLNIQKQIVDEHKTLEETDAGQKYQKELIEMKRLHKRQIDELKEGYQQALKDRDSELAEILKEQRKELEDQLNTASKKQEELKVTFEQMEQNKAAQVKQLLDRFEEERKKTTQIVAAREEDLRRFEEARKSDERRQKEVDEGYDRDRRNLLDRIKELESHRQTSSEAMLKHQLNMKKLDNLQKDMDIRRREAKAKEQAEKTRLETELLKAQRVQRVQQHAIPERDNTDNISSVVMGLGTMWAGAFTVNPVLFVSGATEALGAAFRDF